jgi:hypothetical protein
VDNIFLILQTHPGVFLSSNALQIRGLGMILGTEFTDNKSPNDPFPVEWGK